MELCTVKYIAVPNVSRTNIPSCQLSLCNLGIPDLNLLKWRWNPEYNPAKPRAPTILLALWNVPPGWYFFIWLGSSTLAIRDRAINSSIWDDNFVNSNGPDHELTSCQLAHRFKPKHYYKPKPHLPILVPVSKGVFLLTCNDGNSSTSCSTTQKPIHRIKRPEYIIWRWDCIPAQCRLQKWRVSVLRFGIYWKRHRPYQCYRC